MLLVSVFALSVTAPSAEPLIATGPMNTVVGVADTAASAAALRPAHTPNSNSISQRFDIENNSKFAVQVLPSCAAARILQCSSRRRKPTPTRCQVADPLQHWTAASCRGRPPTRRDLGV